MAYWTMERRTYRDEFYDCTNVRPAVAVLSRHLLAFEQEYNMTRPHQALGQLTPAQFLASRFPNLAHKEALSSRP